MLIQFRVANYLSIKDPVTFSMVAAKGAELWDSNVFQEDKFDLLRSAVLYGANASGKSNFIKAITFARSFILGSQKTQVDEPVPVESFKLNAATENEPSLFEFIFVNQGVRYRYGFQADRLEIKNEWLFHAPKGREAKLFEREKQAIELGEDFKAAKGLEGRVRNNILFLSVAAQFNVELAISLSKWFSRCKTLSGLRDEGFLGYTFKQLERDEFRKRCLLFLKAADLGIEDLKVLQQERSVESLDKLPAALAAKIRDSAGKGGLPGDIKKILTEIKTIHNKYDGDNELVGPVSFDLGTEESAGTRKLFALSGPIMDSLDNGNIVFVDEFDSKLHPSLMQFILSLFHSKENNPKGAQIIFTAHNTYLLNRRTFRRDQVWFVEKDKFGGSHFSSLVDFKIRKTASFDKDYLLGKYGAVPFVGTCDFLGEDHDH